MTLNIYNPVKRKDLSLNLPSFVTFLSSHHPILGDIVALSPGREKMFRAEDYTEKPWNLWAAENKFFFVLPRNAGFGSESVG